MILHFGVIDIPYIQGEKRLPTQKQLKKWRRTSKGTSQGTWTGDVAEFLEAKYHVIEVFYEVHQDEIAEAVVSSLTGTLEALANGAPPQINAFGTAESKIKVLFSDFLTNKEMDDLGYPGVPTKASLEGVSHRFKNRRGKPGRPSFVDTGLYENAFLAWVD